MPLWTHRAIVIAGETLRDDREVLCDGRYVGRVRLAQPEPRRYVWIWTSAATGAGGSGTVDTLEEALAAVRARWEGLSNEQRACEQKRMTERPDRSSHVSDVDGNGMITDRRRRGNYVST